MKLTSTLRAKIDELIELDKQRHSKREKDRSEGKDSMALIMDRTPSPIVVALGNLAPDDLAYVMALMWFGRGGWCRRGRGDF